MIQDQIFQLKITSLQLSAGEMNKAKDIYAWLIEDTKEGIAAVEAKAAAAAAQQQAQVENELSE